MTREEKIEQVASKYCQTNIPSVLQMHLAISTAFEAGAKWADEHPANFWRSVADGDLPTSYVECLFANKKGDINIGYMLDNEAIVSNNNIVGCIEDFEYWAEIPKLPLKELSMGGLFDIPKDKKPSKFCRTCAHRQRWECNSKVIQYCGKRKSNRTFNGLLKIKVTNNACELYEEEVNSN